MHKIINTAKVIALALVLSFGLSYVYAWTAPTATPPGGNVAAPINTSLTTQTKAGDFTLRTLMPNTIAIGLPINANAITAPKFCIGASCITTWPAAGGTGSVRSLSQSTGIILTPNPITTTGTITNSGVTGLTAGIGVILSPSGPGATGAVTVNAKETLLSGTWLGNAAATQGNSSNPRYTSIEITPQIRDKCRIDMGLNPCRLIVLAINQDGTPRAFDHFIATRKVGAKEYVFIEEVTYDNSLVIGDGLVQHMDTGAWVAGCTWRMADFTLCERKAQSNGTWADTTKDDTSLWLSIDQQNVVSAYYYMYK